jgi:hypothetical protein
MAPDADRARRAIPERLAEAATAANTTSVGSHSAPSQRFQVAVYQLHDELIVARVTPAIAVDAADQDFTVVIDFH